MRRQFAVLVMAALEGGFGSSASDNTAPNATVTAVAIAPHSGQTARGEPVVIAGTGFAAGATVTIAGTAATNV